MMATELGEGEIECVCVQSREMCAIGKERLSETERQGSQLMSSQALSRTEAYGCDTDGDADAGGEAEAEAEPSRGCVSCQTPI